MKRSDHIDDVLLARFLGGEASDAERAMVLRRMASDPELQAEMAEYRELWEQAAALPPPRRVTSMLDSLHSRIERAEREPEVRKDGPPSEAPRPLRLVPSAQRPRWLRLIRTAAPHLALGLTLLVVVLWGARVQSAPVAADVTREVQTGRGERMRLQLTDGTRADLGPESTLRMHYVANGPREVELEGEAVFEVAHDPDRPFRVRSANAIVEVLGTTFGIRAYPGENSLRAVVAEGVVVLRPNVAGDLAVLRPGDIGILDAKGRIETHTGQNAAGYLGWAENHLFYEEVPLREIAADLERWHDVTVLIPDSGLAATPMTLNLYAPTLDEVLHAIVVPLDIHSERDAKTIVLRR